MARRGKRVKGEGGGKDDNDDMCFLASRGIITLELTADEEGMEKKGGREGRVRVVGCRANNGPIISARRRLSCHARTCGLKET